MSDIKLRVFRCFLCQKKLNSPRDLPCLHTFCGLCIKNLIEKTDHAENLRLECPVCFDTFSAPSSDLSLKELVDIFPRNQLVEELIGTADPNEVRKSCDPCLLVNEEKAAQYHCSRCRQSLCETCYTYMHRRIPDQASHHVTTIKEYLETGPIETNEFCPSHPQNCVEVFCFDHGVPCCTLCTSSCHKYCLHVESLDKAFEQSSKELNPMVLKQLIANIKEKVNDALVNVNKKENAGTFRDIDKQVSNLVNKLNERIGTVHKIFETHQKSIQEKDKEMLRQSKMQVEGLLKLAEEAQLIIQSVEQVGSKRQTFVTTLKLKQQLMIFFQKIRKTLARRTNWDLTINPSIEKFVEEIDSIAELHEKVLDSLLTSEIQNQAQLLFRYINYDMESETSRYLDIKPKLLARFTQKESSFCGGVLLSSGKILLIDQWYMNNALFSVTNDGKFTKLYKFPKKPTAICVDEKEERIAVNTEEGLHVFSLFPLFEQIRKIETELYVTCVYFWDEYFVCCEYSRIAIINNDGEILKTIYGPIADPAFFGISNDRKKLYMFDDKTSEGIVCLDFDGSVVFRRESPLNLENRDVGWHGMGVDCYGNLYVCERGGEVYQLESNGNRMRSVLSREDRGQTPKLKKPESGSDSDSDGSDSDGEWGELNHVKTISFDKSGKRFLICSRTDTVELFEIN